jgi:uncharacterized membrane protein YkoI
MTSFQRIFVLFLFATINSSAFAKSLPDDIEPGDGINEIELPLNKKSAAELVRIETKGKILSVEKNKINGKNIFVVKTLHNDGKVKNHYLDSQTGRAPN